MASTTTDPNSPSTLTLRVEGMACSGCVERVEKAIRATDGVTSTSVDLAGKRAVVTFAGTPDPRAVIASIVALGYEAELEPA